MIKLVRHLFYRFMSRYDHLPSDDCLSYLQGKRLVDMEPEWQVAYLEYVYRLDCSKHYQVKPNRAPD